eukprot:COSAG06_NODE_51109_length_314_cov_0.804651_1_plen_39_part_10
MLATRGSLENDAFKNSVELGELPAGPAPPVPITRTDASL